MKNSFLFLMVFIGYSYIFAQELNLKTIKELRKIIMHSRDVEKATYCYQLSKYYLGQHRLDSAHFYSKEMVHIAEHLQDLPLLQKACYLQGDVLYYSNDYRLSNDFYKKAQSLSLQNKDTLHYVDLLLDRAYIYQTWQKKDTLMTLLNEAMHWSNQLHYYKGIGRASMLMGSIYHDLNKYGKALEFYKKALQAAKKIPDNRGIGIAYSNIGMSYLELENYTQAVENLHKSIPFMQKEKAYVQIGNTFGDLAIIYSKIGRINQTNKNLKKACQIYKKYGTSEDKAIGFNVKSECLFNLKRYNESNQFLDSCIQIAHKIGFGLMLQKSYKSYAENFKRLGKYNKAYVYLKKHNLVKDSLLSLRYQKELAEFDVKYKTLEKQQKIERLQHKQKLDKANFKILLVSAVSLLSFILIGAYIMIQKRRKEKEIAELELEKMQLEAQNLSTQLSYKNRQLTTHAINMLQKNKLLAAFGVTLSQIISLVEGEAKNKLLYLKREVKHLLHSERDWETFKIYFEQVNKDFLKKIKQVNPNLTTNEIRLLTLIKLNMSNKEIASILNITHQSVKNALYRLKNKLGLSMDQDLRKFISSL